jgi:hypothetical protein
MDPWNERKNSSADETESDIRRSRSLLFIFFVHSTSNFKLNSGLFSLFSLTFTQTRRRQVERRGKVATFLILLDENPFFLFGWILCVQLWFFKWLNRLLEPSKSGFCRRLISIFA